MIMKKLLSLILALVMVLTAIPMNSASAEALLKGAEPAETLSFALMSDTHYYPKSLTGDYNEAFMFESDAALAKNYIQSEPLLDCALAAYAEHAKEKDLKYLVISGDLSSNGEYQAHVELAQRLEKFEAETGIQVLVINGNHDINKKQAETFVNGKREAARFTTPEEFREIYKNLGYDLACTEYEPSTGKANTLSYAVRDGKYRFIMIDTAAYSPEVTKDGSEFGETRGCMTDECLQWVLGQIEEAKANGEEPITVQHHTFAYHFKAEYTILRGFVIDNWQYIGETLADAGLHFALTGHIHQNDIARVVTDDGNVINEICSPSVSTFPNSIREVTATTQAGKTTLDVKSYDVDCVKPVEVNGYTYPVPYRKESIKITFMGYNGFADKASSFLLSFLKKYSEEFAEKGIMNALSDMGLDLRGIFEGLLGKGLKIGKINIFSADNLLMFCEDLFNQIYALYLDDPEATAAFLKTEIEKLMSIQVSELPNTRFLEEYGIGDPEKPGTLEDLLANVMIYNYAGDDTYEDDEFFMDALYQLENGDTAFKLFDVLLDAVVDDIVQQSLLQGVEFRPETLFKPWTPGRCIVTFFTSIITFFLCGDRSLLNVANSVLKVIGTLGIVEFKSLWGLLEHYMDEYLTDPQLQGIGQTLAGIVLAFAEDDNYKYDSDATITYDGPVEVEATRENYRLPTAITVTLGQDASSRNISWYTKNTVNGSDIEIVEKTASPVFTGENLAPANVKVTAETVKTTRQFPGVDLGVIGIMNYEFEMNRHIVNVSGMEAGKTYLYRVGDASRGWWSETGSFRIEDGSNETTFVHIGDPQSQSEQQYQTFAKLIDKAYDMYDFDFIVDTGDNVDHGDNFNQWQWFLDTASDTLMNTVLMSAAGNHEDKGTNAIDKNFVYSNVPEQDVTTGIYFSFDYNNVHVAILNTNNLDDDDSLNDEQIEWLKDDMKSSDADWKFVAFHKAPYSNGSHYDDDDVIEIRKELSKLMPQLGIDMVFQGHDHVYLRTDAMINNKVEDVTTSTAEFDGKTYNVKVQPVGTVYAISGCSGVKIYKQKDAALTDRYFPRAEVIKDVDYSVFSGIRVVDNMLYFDAYTFDAETGDTENIDSFAIQKDLSIVKGGKHIRTPFKFKDIFNPIVIYVIPVFQKLFAKIEAFFDTKKLTVA